MASRLRNGKGYEHAVFGMLTLADIDVYEPLVDDQGIDGVIRVDPGNNAQIKYYDLQVKGSKTWSGVRGRVRFSNPQSVLIIFCAKEREVLWFMFHDVNQYFSDNHPEWGNIFLKKTQVEKFKAEGRCDLNQLRKQLSSL